MTPVSRVMGVLALIGTPITGCGARSWLPVDPLPDADTGDGAMCSETPVALEPNVPNLYFVLDRSKSMLDQNKWTNVRSAAANLIGQLKASARFGATLFPGPGGGGCATGAEVMPLRLGDDLGATANAFLAATALTPNGGTPTAATFRSLLPKFSAVPGITVAILATDGGPNCDPNLVTCPIDQCTSNIDGITDGNGVQLCFPNIPPNCCDAARSGGTGCLDGNATAQAVAALRAIGVQTYVMGIPGSSPYGPILDQLAIAGGTARSGQPRYYAVTSADESALASAFQDIVTQAMKSCSLILGHAVADPNRVNVYIDGTVVPSSGRDGWSTTGRTVTLKGATCDAFRAAPSAGAPPLRVAEGCATVR
ncbi:MAG: VWA domain-containing protein [Myxococcota bacterium]|nr:VWA domain-containing protein [Myxococcota bacterium]